MNTTNSNSEHIGTIIEQWFKRFEFIAKEDEEQMELTKGKMYPLVSVDFQNRRLSVEHDGYWETFNFDQVPDYFEIRIREN